MSETGVAVQVEEISSVKKKLLFDIPWEEVKKEQDETYKDLAKSAKIKGFRQGRIPREVLDVYYKEHAEGETISNLLKKFYQKTLEEKGIVPIAQPHIDQKGIEKNKNFTFTATIEVEPVIEPSNYIGMELEREEFDVTAEDIEERIQQVRQLFASLEEVGEDRGVMEGDTVIFDFEGKLDGKSLKELKAEDYSLEVGSKNFFPGFEEQLLGMKREESGQIPIKFPDSYHIEHIAGKEVVFYVSLKNIKVKKLPELDENFISNFDKFESMEELREDIRKSLEEENKAKADAALNELIINKLLEANEFEVPSSFVESQIFYMMADTQQRMTLNGMDRKKAAEFSFQLRDHFSEEATRIVKTGLLLRSITQKESITVDENEVEDHIRDMAREHVQNYESLRESWEKSGKSDYIREDILNKKAFDFIKKAARIAVVKQKEVKKEEENNS